MLAFWCVFVCVCMCMCVCVHTLYTLYVHANVIMSTTKMLVGKGQSFSCPCKMCEVVSGDPAAPPPSEWSLNVPAAVFYT